VIGLINVQFAVKAAGEGIDDGHDGEVGSAVDGVYVIEANPRASRTVPFVAKATGVPLVKVASRVMVGATLDELRTEGLMRAGSTDGHVAVKEAVLPFNRFPDADRVLGPEMRSTGEVMGIDRSFGLAFAKSQIAAGDRLPESGQIFFSLADRDKPSGITAARQFLELGFQVVATDGTAAAFEAAGVTVARRVAKLGTGEAGETAVDLIDAGDIQMVVNSPRGRGPRADGGYIRAAAGVAGIPCLTTAAAALAAAEGMADWASHDLQVKPLQDFH
jgi:carbamoyl-phosphate synthase large subunit